MSTMPSKYKKQLREEGYVVIANLAESALAALSKSLGPIVTDPRNPEAIREIRPEIPSDKNVNTLTHKHGMGAFPFHTDCAHWELPAKYLILYCVNPGKAKRPTLLVDSNEWIWNPDELVSLRNSVWKRALRVPRLCTVIEFLEGQQFIRFDEACMTPLTQEAELVRNAILQRIDGSRSTEIVWCSRNALVIDNHRMLHARGRSNVADPDRLLKRILIGA